MIMCTIDRKMIKRAMENRCLVVWVEVGPTPSNQNALCYCGFTLARDGRGIPFYLARIKVFWFMYHRILYGFCLVHWFTLMSIQK